MLFPALEVAAKVAVVEVEAKLMAPAAAAVTAAWEMVQVATAMVVLVVEESTECQGKYQVSKG